MCCVFLARRFASAVQLGCLLFSAQKPRGGGFEEPCQGPCVAQVSERYKSPPHSSRALFAFLLRSRHTPPACGIRPDQPAKMLSAVRAAAAVAARPLAPAMARGIAVGTKIPSESMKVVTGDEVADAVASEYFAGKKVCPEATSVRGTSAAHGSPLSQVVLVGIPGAFTGTCYGTHIPDFVQHADEIKAKVRCATLERRDVLHTRFRRRHRARMPLPCWA